MKPVSEKVLVLLVVLSIGFLFLIPTGFEKKIPNHKDVRASIISTDDTDLQRVGLLLVGTQSLRVVLQGGSNKGDTLKTHNVLNGQMSYDHYYKTGDEILLTLKYSRDLGKIVQSVPVSIYRSQVEVVLFLLFAGFLIAFSRWTGFKALISFVFTALVIWKLLIPLFLKGYNPVPVSLGLTLLSTGVIIFLIAGFSRKGFTAFAGAAAGILFTASMAVGFGGLFQIPGTVKDFAEMILYAGFLNLNMTKIFLAGIFISAAGAVMDVAMDIAASQEEIIRENPNISSKELIAAGFRVGHAVIGTMTTTLLFAYSGNFTFVLMMFMSRGVPLEQVFNTSFVAAEILQTLVGSFGLVLVAPLTAIAGGVIFRKKS